MGTGGMENRSIDRGREGGENRWQGQTKERELHMRRREVSGAAKRKTGNEEGN